MPKPRSRGGKTLRPKLHIFCEGEKTEPNYLNGYLEKFHSSNRLLKVVTVEKTRKNTPVQLVEVAIDLKKSENIPEDDIFWVVYDRESETKYSDVLHRKAFEKAKRNDINVSLTNVCFEIWLLLHFTDAVASFSSCDDLLKRSPLKGELKKIGITCYKKSDPNIFEIISARIPDARVRADRMNRATINSSYETEENPYRLNPYTGIHNLLDAIDEFVQNQSM